MRSKERWSSRPRSGRGMAPQWCFMSMCILWRGLSPFVAHSWWLSWGNSIFKDAWLKGMGSGGQGVGEAKLWMEGHWFESLDKQVIWLPLQVSMQLKIGGVKCISFHFILLKGVNKVWLCFLNFQLWREPHQQSAGLNFNLGRGAGINKNGAL